MSDDFERQFRQFQVRLETEMRMMEEAIRRHEEAMEQAIQHHQHAIERAWAEFDRKFGHLPLRPRRGRGRRPKRGPDLEPGGVPVKPNNPKGLSGGAEASIDAGD